MMAASSRITKIGRYLIDESKELCRGNYGVILFRSKHVYTKQEVVVKRYEVAEECPEDVLARIEKEAHIMRDIPLHPNVLPILDYEKTDGINEKQEKVIYLWLILEYCSRGNLKDFAKVNDLSFTQKVGLMLQSAEGVKHIHQQQVAHGDLKPDNILLTETNINIVVKIADFGESKFVGGTMYTPRGTKPFQPPEIPHVTGISYNKTVDIFALGCTWYAFLDFEHGQSMKPIVERSYIGDYLHNHPGVDLARVIIKDEDRNEVVNLKRLLAAMMAYQSSDRPTIQEVIGHLLDIFAGRSPAPIRTREARNEETARKVGTGAVVRRVFGSIQSALVRKLCVSDCARDIATLTEPYKCNRPTQDPRRQNIQDIHKRTEYTSRQNNTSGPENTSGQTNPGGQTNTSRQENTSGQDNSARIKSAKTTRLPEETSSRVSFGGNGDLVVTDTTHACLFVPSPTPASSSSHIYAEKIPLPPGVRVDCNQAVTDDSLYVQNRQEDAPTMKVSFKTPRQTTILYHQGLLIGVLDNAPVYNVKQRWENYIINVHQSAGQMVLKPYPYRWKWALSVCNTDENIAVVEMETHSLDVFTKKGDHIRHTDLLHEVRSYSAITCFTTSKVIVAVCKPPALHIHKTIGDWAVPQTINHQRLKLRQDDHVYAVNYCNGLITVVVGRTTPMGSETISLRTYEVFYS